MMTDRTMESVDSMYSSMRSPLPSGHSSDADIKLRQAQALASNPERFNSEALAGNFELELGSEIVFQNLYSRCGDGQAISVLSSYSGSA
uniref:SH3 domain-containing protein n=1 Tax=Heterorhabditis bacteriophora TaxID=37862 RepID=A0A1I7XJ35_HETBA